MCMMTNVILTRVGWDIPVFTEAPCLTNFIMSQTHSTYCWCSLNFLS